MTTLKTNANNNKTIFLVFVLTGLLTHSKKNNSISSGIRPSIIKSTPLPWKFLSIIKEELLPMSPKKHGLMALLNVLDLTPCGLMTDMLILLNPKLIKPKRE